MFSHKSQYLEENYRKENKGLILDNVKKFCDKKGMSISAVEKQAELSNGTIRKWNISNPRIGNLLAVAKVLGVTIDELLS